MSELLNIHSVIEKSRVNGPGTRLVIFTQGCERGCSGCFNSALHTSEGGIRISPAELLKTRVSGAIEGITVSGGEPFDQVEALQRLLKTAKEEFNLSTVVYTGYNHETLISRENTAACLDYIDVLIDGEFVESKKEKTLLARGSSNQKIIILNDRYKEEDFHMPGKVEITIGADGTVTSTGFSDPGFGVKDAI
ncbi:MAG: anaerobic ribonucleoside-triphosphate reductase activating protein [Thermodesulfobacteriota bacterium]